MLLLTRLSFLQQIQKAAVSGYVFYVSGKCRPDKFPGLIKKFQQQYQINQTRQQVYLKKIKGDASAKFYAYAHPDDKQAFFWVLMLTEGQHLAHAIEDLKDLKVKSARLQYGDYHLIQKPSSKGKPSFTWALTKDSYHYYASLIRTVIRSRNLGAVRDLQKHLSVMPGFSGVRSQKVQLQKIFKGEAKRHFQIVAEDKIQNRYARQQKIEQVIYLEAFIKKLIDNDLTILQKMKIHRENLRKRSTKDQ